MTIAVGTKNPTAAKTHREIEEVPLCEAAAIQRGPRTAAMLKSSRSQKPMTRRNCDLGSAAGGGVWLTPFLPGLGSTRLAPENFARTHLWYWPAQPRCRRNRRGLPVGR